MVDAPTDSDDNRDEGESYRHMRRQSTGRGSFRPVCFEQRRGADWIVVRSCTDASEVLAAPEEAWTDFFCDDLRGVMEAVWLQEISLDISDLRRRIADSVWIADDEDHVRLLRQWVEFRQLREAIQ